MMITRQLEAACNSFYLSFSDEVCSMQVGDFLGTFSHVFSLCLTVR